MLRTFFWYSCGWTYLVLTIPALWMANLYQIIGLAAKHDKLVQKVTSRAARVLLYLTGSKVDVEGAENIPETSPVVFVCNHEGHMDSAVVHGFISKSKGFISIIEVLKFPILRTWMKHMNCVFMDRSDIKQSVECINKGVEHIKNGHSMVIFPEGRLSDGNEVGDFKRGSLKLAIKARVPVVPVSIMGTYKVMSKVGKNIRPYYIKCIISDPINTANLNRDEEQALAEKVRNIIIDNMKPCTQENSAVV